MKLNRPYPLDAPEIGAASACRRSGEHGDLGEASRFGYL
jgi:hypothetical protein